MLERCAKRSRNRLTRRVGGRRGSYDSAVVNERRVIASSGDDILPRNNVGLSISGFKGDRLRRFVDNASFFVPLCSPVREMEIIQSRGSGERKDERKNESK